MTVEAYMNQARWLDLQISAKLERVEHLRAVTGARTASYGVEPRGPRKPDRTLNIVTNIIELEHELEEEIAQLVNLQREIGDAIHNVPDERCQALLEFRYLAGMTWEQIASAMHYTVRNVYILHSRALEQVSLHNSDRFTEEKNA